MASQNRILVLGGTGKIGEHLVKSLAGKAQVSVLARNIEKAKKLYPDGVTVLEGDLEKFDTITAALKHGFERLFILTTNYGIEGKIAQQAKAAGVQLIVKISCWLAAVSEEPGSIYAQHAEAEQAVAAAGVPWVFLRPADFMQNLLTNAGTIKGMGKIFHAHGDAQLASIDAADIAACAAAVLLADIKAYANRTYTLTGSEALTRTELAAKVKAALGRDVVAVGVSEADFEKTLINVAKLPPYVAFLLAQLGTVYRLRLTGNRFSTSAVEQLTGRKARTWDQFLAENKAAFA